MTTKINQQIDTVYPLTGMQHGMIFHTMLSPDSDVYTIQDGLEITGPLNVAAFWSAWTMVIERHDVFRTLFMRLDTEKPLQVVLKKAMLPMKELDWTTLSHSEQAQLFHSLLLQERQKKFDFTRPPLMRFVLIRCDAQRYRLIWTHHHVIIDGWSGPLVVREVFEFYQQLTAGVTPTTSRPRQFREYVQYLQQQDLQLAQQFWQQYLSGVTEKTPLYFLQPLDERAPLAPAFGSVSMQLSQTLSAQIRDAAAHCQVTVNTMFQLAWALLLSKLSGRQQVMFGATVAGRPAVVEGAAQIVGPFINTLPVVVQLEPSNTVGAALLTLQQQNSRKADFEYYPLSKIKECLPQLGQTNLFDSIVVFDNYPIQQHQQQMETATRLQLKKLSSFSYNNFPLTLMVVPDQALRLEIKFDQQLVSQQAAQVLLAQLSDVLQQMALAPAQSIRQLTAGAVVSAVETRHWQSPTNGVGPLLQSLRQTQPQTTAICYRDQSYSYEWLVAGSNRLANLLLSQSLGDRPVAICMRRSPQLMVAIFGCLLAGIPYVPVDSSWPAQKLTLLAQQIDVAAIITEQSCLDMALHCHQDLVISLDRDWDELQQFSDTAPAVSIVPQQLAYLILTSGTTGQSKAAMVTQQNLLHYVAAIETAVGFDRRSTWSYLSTIAADLGYTALFGALCTGGTLLLVEEPYVLDAGYLATLFRRHQLDVLKIVPSHLQALLDASTQPTDLLPARQLILGGEATSARLKQLLALYAGECKLWNHYGPTECTIGVSCGEFTPDGAVSLGAPLGKNRLLVLDDDLRPCGLLQPGLLYVSGPGVGAGYWQQPGQTACVFLPDPSAHGQRLYATGDLVYQNEAGALFYLGRQDGQLKINGYRVETAAAESLLLTVPDVKAAVVHARSVAGLQTLVAYLVVAGDWQEAAYGQVLAALPAYARPTRFVRLDALPVTLNGKLDKARLNQLDIDVRTAVTIAPRHPVEQQIWAIWAALLKSTSFGVTDNFFSIGGNSMLLIQLFSQMKAISLQPLQVVDLFQHPTVEAQTALVTGQQRELIDIEKIQARLAKRQLPAREEC
ncbi:hypothetical protein A5320_02660 [Rheinheimera sp. SA_1]|uniref:condensation domain-containing protein n=1 Tax=Rheinheimera sp. SA_1 TaxID=1827365 RepID=UPI0007FEC89D|nr:condensation domain-containing protein [Rheinheimera sp. SA_1]OBP16329.1 hypothetical protein A5320_02660 [Rheinheimera sp. SA_1]